MTRAEERKERDTKALELRRAGATFDRIAAQLGFANRGSAKKAYDRALKATGGPEVDRFAAREQEVDRLDRLLTAVWPKAMKGELDSVREARQISRLRIHLLGLSVAPTPYVGSQDLDDDDAPPQAPGDVIPESRLAQRRRELDDARRNADTGSA